jgi:hypothetical protein
MKLKILLQCDLENGSNEHSTREVTHGNIVFKTSLINKLEVIIKNN